jgi:hypothetical protein
MTGYSARTCPRGKDYFGVVVPEPDDTVRERPIDTEQENGPGRRTGKAAH